VEDHTVAWSQKAENVADAAVRASSPEVHIPDNRAATLPQPEESLAAARLQNDAAVQVGPEVLASTLGVPRSALLSPLQAAVVTKDVALVKALLVAGCQYEDCSALDTPQDFKLAVQELMAHPRTLMECCRMVVRRMMRQARGVGPRQAEVLEKVRLPSALRDFILLNDLKPQACTIM
jgi:hypothetical protein